jgi:hypothetical protein
VRAKESMHAVNHDHHDHQEEEIPLKLPYLEVWLNKSTPFMLELKDNRPLDLVVALCKLVGLIYKYIVLNFQGH